MKGRCTIVASSGFAWLLVTADFSGFHAMRFVSDDMSLAFYKQQDEEISGGR
jgi:hypothetical protein